jgi:acyl-CoA reductase-like NAD-dependent aldehyde dehydrogenase
MVIRDELLIGAKWVPARSGRRLAEDTVIGPLVSAEHLARVQDYVSSGRSEGARPRRWWQAPGRPR